MKEGIDYIVVEKLPIEQQAPLKHWLIGKTIPSIENKKGTCCYKGDYDVFIKLYYRGMISKYFKGWVKSYNMNIEEWYDVFYNTAKKVEEEKCELVVFKIPADKNHLISDIEKMLQEKLK